MGRSIGCASMFFSDPPGQRIDFLFASIERKQGDVSRRKPAPKTPDSQVTSDILKAGKPFGLAITGSDAHKRRIMRCRHIEIHVSTVMGPGRNSYGAEAAGEPPPFSRPAIVNHEGLRI